MKFISVSLCLFILINYYPSVSSVDKIEVDNGNNYNPHDHFKFWVFQFIEHVEFTLEFTQDSKIHEQAKSLLQRLQAQENDKKNFRYVCHDMKKYLHSVITHLKNDKRDHVLDLALIDHMLKETDYAQKKVSGKRMSKRQEAKFWGEEHEGQATVMATLINKNTIDARNLSINAKYLADHLKTNKDCPTILQANYQLDDIDRKLNQNPQQSAIPLKLAQHEERERAYAKIQLKNCQSR